MSISQSAASPRKKGIDISPQAPASHTSKHFHHPSLFPLSSNFSLPEHHPQHIALALPFSSTRTGALVRLPAIWIANRTRRRKEQHLDRDRKARMQRQHNNKQDLARLRLGGAEHGVQVGKEEEGGEGEAEGDEDIVENCTPSMLRRCTDRR
jgi:hypothetical protein